MAGRGKRLGQAVLAVALGAAGIAVVPAGTAWACGGTQSSGTVGDDVAAASYSITVERCGDGQAQVTGTVYDKGCDSRSAKVQVTVQDYRGSGNYVTLWTKSATATNGCGTNATYSLTGPSAGSVGGYVKVETWAYNTWGSSTHRTFGYSY
ncbi:hypothetical protein V5P93_002764 [Actinokineospora auranticolor]|uniref:Secreted protein n=1 Tax=Actinokineospora auranticolor TaxID=155976 RepID=A0A2S6H098_9PSEU|nr:hypothetical protein [Actinokineospora auranticolor]PPK70905.1 hypothetical protein CLV40_10191 [Actinokineospora auranticolor]